MTSDIFDPRAPQRVRHETRQRLLTVTAVPDITPRMRRFSFSGDMEGFASPGHADHIKVFFFPAGVEPKLVRIGPNGAEYAPGERPEMRDYTPRYWNVEAGTIVLVGATTENPSFEVNSALLSRARVYVLEPLTTEHPVTILRRALADTEHGLGTMHVDADDEALAALAVHASGDARVTLNLLEQVVGLLPVIDDRRRLDRAALEGLIERRALRYDKAGEDHYNLVSALHKSVRNSDADAAGYWLARMSEPGEDPLYLARRLVRMASEDIGLADPRALEIALAAKDAVHFLGMPEGNTALAQCAIYLSAAPKSNAVYTAYGAAARDALRDEATPVPLHLRNAPTKLMKGIGYGKGYRYAHDEAEGVAAMSCLPENLQGRRYYEPTDRGIEARIREALARARAIRERKG